MSGSDYSVTPAAVRLSLRSNVLWTLIGNLSYAGCQWGILIVLARWGSAEMVGLFGLALAVSNPIIMFTNLQLGVVQATDAQHHDRFEDYLAVRLIMTALGLATIAGVVAAQNYDAEAAQVILIVGIAKGVEAISDIIYGALQQHERVDRIAYLQICKGLMSLLLVGMVIAITGSLVWAATSMAVLWTACLFLVDFPVVAWIFRHANAPDRMSPRWNWPTISRMSWQAAPLGFAMLLASLMINVPQYFVEHYLSRRELGIFVAVSSLMILGRKFFNPVVQTTSTRLARHYAERNRPAFLRLILRIFVLATAIGGAGVLAAMIAGRPLLAVLFGAEYADHQSVLIWLMVSLALSLQSSLDPAFTALRCLRIQFVLGVMTLLTLIGFLLWMAPGHGLVEIAKSVTYANLVRLVLSLTLIAVAIQQRFAEPLHPVAAGSRRSDVLPGVTVNKSIA